MFGLRRAIAPLLAVIAGPSLAQSPAAPSEAVAAFDAFVRAAAPTCLSRPAATCVDTGWTFADRDRDQGLTPAEFAGLRQDLQDWFQWRAPELTPRERNTLTFALFFVDSIGMDQIVAGFDGNGDGRVTRAELLADVTLDERPLGEVLLDPAAVDRPAVIRRFGPVAALLPELAE